MTRAIMHVDMDAFYASVEQAWNPELEGLPISVGGGAHGVVLSANYLARSQGVRSGMAASRARRLCPDLVEVRPDFDHYAQVSASVKALLCTITDRVEMASIDEAYLDVTGCRRRLGTPAQIGEMIRNRVADEQRITCSVGIGPNRLVAKMASQQCKPDGLLEVGESQVVDFLHPLPIEAMWGVGEATAQRLREFGVTTIEQLAHLPPDTLQRLLGPKTGAVLARHAWGIDERPIQVYRPERSIGSQTTLAHPVSDPQVVTTEILRLCVRVASRLRAAGMCAGALSLSLRLTDRPVSISRTLGCPSDLTDDLYQMACTLFQGMNLQRSLIRSVHLRAEKLVKRSEVYVQPVLGEEGDKKRDVEKVTDRITQRFGPDAVGRARLASRNARRRSA